MNMFENRAHSFCAFIVGSWCIESHRWSSVRRNTMLGRGGFAFDELPPHAVATIAAAANATHQRARRRDEPVNLVRTIGRRTLSLCHARRYAA
jgi:hypothetical protein